MFAMFIRESGQWPYGAIRNSLFENLPPKEKSHEGALWEEIDILDLGEQRETLGEGRFGLGKYLPPKAQNEFLRQCLEPNGGEWMLQ